MAVSIGEIMVIYAKVAASLSSDETFGEGYQLDCYEYNVECVMKDIAAGKIPKPATQEEMVKAILDEYRANLASAKANATFHVHRY
jgi:hypothetical protein